jgi:lambda repressor-like predicted transcriptional regulator
MTEECGAELSDGGTCSFNAKFPDGKCGHHTEENDSYQDRDSKLTKQRQEEIAQAIERGKSINSASRMAGISPQTFYNWLDKGEQQEEGVYAEFFDRITHAKGKGEDFYFNTVWELAKQQGDHRFLASLMKQRYPDSWEDTDTGVEADTINIEISENVADTWPEIQ